MKTKWLTLVAVIKEAIMQQPEAMQSNNVHTIEVLYMVINIFKNPRDILK